MGRRRRDSAGRYGFSSPLLVVTYVVCSRSVVTTMLDARGYVV
jgi:hypothetical protein